MVRLPCVPVFLSVFLTVTAAAGPTDYQSAILHPSGLTFVSDACGISGGWQVDYRSREERALPWLGTAESAVNLQLNGFTDLRAYGTGLGLRAGWGWSANEWFDTTESVLGLHPRYTHSVAEGTWDRQQIKYRELSDTWGIEYALLWSGTVIDTPTANGNNVTTRRDMPVSTTLASSDPDGDLPTYGLAAAPSHGSLSGTEPNLTYTADTNFNGSNRLVFEAEAAEAKPTNLKKYIGVGIGVFVLLGGLTVALAKGQRELKKTMLYIVGAVRSTIRSRAQSKDSSPKTFLATLPERVLQNRKTPIMREVDTRQAKKAKTVRRGGSKPYGFFEGEKKLIKRIEQLHQKPKGGTRLGPYQIARILNREGWPTRKATEWRGSQVSAILKRLGPKPVRKGPEHS